LAEEEPRLVLITAAMATGTGADAFARLFPQRFVDVGICEDHAVTFAAGLARQGFRPFVAVYSTFLQRAYDQILHDVCLQNLPVTLCLDRAGIVGEDGATHHGLFDVAYLRHIPNMHCLAPRDEPALQRALRTGISLDRPLSIRYPRGSAPGVPLLPGRGLEPLVPGRGEMMRQGCGVAVIALGSCLHPALAAAQNPDSGRSATVYDPVWIKPLPEEALCRLARTHQALLFVEEHALAGGFSSAVLELLADRGICVPHIRRIGIGDAFVLHGPQQALRAGAGLDAASIRKELEQLWEKISTRP
jgi:1-deoxy-D-xylulose-5-phosphate synthase